MSDSPERIYPLVNRDGPDAICEVTLGSSSVGVAGSLHRPRRSDVTPIRDLIGAMSEGDERPDLDGLEEADEELRALARAMTNPAHTAILVELARDPGALDASGLARATGHPVAAVRRHLRVLLDAGLVRVVREEPRRGTVNRFYGPGPTPLRIGAGEEARLPRATLVRIAVAILREILGEARRSLGAGTFLGRPDRVLARVPATVDEQGWAELAAIQARALAEIERVCAESGRRLARERGRPLALTAALLLFEIPPRDAEDA